MKVDINVPPEYMGAVIGDITSRRGRVAEIDDRNDFKYILAHIPLDEMFGYTTIFARSPREGDIPHGVFPLCPVPSTHIYESLMKNREKTVTEALYG